MFSTPRAFSTFSTPGVERADDPLLLVDVVVDVALEAADDRGEPVVQLGGVGDLARDDQRRAGLVDEDRVDLVDDRVDVAALDALLGGHRHVVAEVVEPELVVGAVGDVARVLRALVVPVVLVGEDHADGEAQPVVEPTHPLGVTLGQVVVDRDDVDALAGQSVEVHRQRRDEGLALAGLHLGDPPEVQRGAAHQLHVVVALADGASRRLADRGERLDQQVVELLAVVEPLAELTGLGLEVVVGRALRSRARSAPISGTSSASALTFRPSPTRRNLSNSPMGQPFYWPRAAARRPGSAVRSLSRSSSMSPMSPSSRR